MRAQTRGRSAARDAAGSAAPPRATSLRVWRGAVAAAAAGIVVVAHLMLGVAAAPGRWAAISPSGDVTATTAFHWAPIDSVYRERGLSVVLVHADVPSPPAPPGITAFPAPGQAYVSPALARAIAHDPSLAHRVPGEVVGTIAAAGLTAPDQLRAVVGAADDADLYRAAGWGSDGMTELGVLPVGQTVLGLALVWGLPALVLAVACAHAAAGRLRPQVARLRVLGASSRQLRGYVRRTSLRTAGPPALAGVAGATVVVLATARSGLLGLTFFPPAMAGSLALGAVAAAALSGLVASWAGLWIHPVLRDPYRMARRPTGPGRTWPLGVAALGAAVLAGIAAVRWATLSVMAPTATAEAALLAGAAGLVVGAGLGAPRMLRWWSGRREWADPSTALAMAQAAHDPGPVTLASFAMIAVTTVTALTIAITQLMAPEEALGRWGASVGAQASADVPALLRSAGRDVFLETGSETAGDVWATCTALAAELGPLRGPDGTCHDGRTYAPGELQSPDDRPAGFTRAATTVHTTDPVADPPARPAGSAIYVSGVLTDPDAQQSAILAAAPHARLTVQGGTLDLLVTVPALRTQVQRSAVGGALLALATLLLALSTSPTSAASQDRLRRIGAPSATLRAVARRHAAATMLAAGAVAVAVAALVQQAYLALGSLYTVDVATLAALAGTVVVCTALAALMASLAVPRDRSLRRSARKRRTPPAPPGPGDSADPLLSAPAGTAGPRMG